MGYIYNIKNKINGKIYIGQTIRPIKIRLKEHRVGKSKKCRAIYNAIQKHGWKNFEIDWYECPDEDLNKHEKWLVKLMGTISPEGYNLKEGGGNSGKASEETKQKCRESQLGHTVSERTKQKIGKANGGKNHPMYGKTGENHYNYGKIHSEESRQKHSDSIKGENNHASKRVYRYDLVGTFIDSFGSCGEASLHVEGDTSRISKCARGAKGIKTAYGFKWSYIKH